MRGRCRGLSTLVAVLPLVGCHSLIVCNVGIANKSAAALATPLSAQAYCMALIAPDINLRGQLKKSPAMSAEQKEFCNNAEKETVK